MSTILVTGAGGFLGGAVARALLERGDAVVALDCEAAKAGVGALSAGFKTCAGAIVDVCDAAALDRVFTEHRPDAVVHCAAIVGVLASVAAPQKLLRVNIEGSVNLFEEMVKHGCNRIIHISSEEIYGDFDRARVDETYREAPLYAYGISKSAVEHLGRSYNKAHGLECINVRTSWVYGPGFPRDRVPMNMVRAAAEGRTLHVLGGADERIDHTYLDDAVAGILGALDCADHPFDAYHIASDSAPSLAEIAEIVRDLVPDADVIVGDGHYHHGDAVEITTKGALDCGRAKAVFGYEPKFDIRKGLAATLAAHQAVLAETN